MDERGSSDIFMAAKTLESSCRGWAGMPKSQPRVLCTGKELCVALNAGKRAECFRSLTVRYVVCTKDFTAALFLPYCTDGLIPAAPRASLQFGCYRRHVEGRIWLCIG